MLLMKKSSLGQIRWEQMVFLGKPEFGCEHQPIDLQPMRALAAEPALPTMTRRAVVDAQGFGDPPVLIEAVVDPNELPMPPKLTVQQMASLAASLARRTPNRRRIALTIASDTVRELI
jgi:pyruvate dehydrogenase (quinone)